MKKMIQNERQRFFFLTKVPSKSKVIVAKKHVQNRPSKPWYSCRCSPLPWPIFNNTPTPLLHENFICVSSPFWRIQQKMTAFCLETFQTKSPQIRWSISCCDESILKHDLISLPIQNRTRRFTRVIGPLKIAEVKKERSRRDPRSIGAQYISVHRSINNLWGKIFFSWLFFVSMKMCPARKNARLIFFVWFASDV